MVRDEQVRLLRKKMPDGLTQEGAAAVAGMCVRTARTWQDGPLPGETKGERAWRTRADPFEEVWDTEVVPLLEADKEGVLEATTVLDELRRRKGDAFGPHQLRTLQRRMHHWRVLYGPGKTVGLVSVGDARNSNTAAGLDVMSTDESKDLIYLDNNAPTPLLPEVVDAMLPFLTTHFGNPSSGHVYGARAKTAVDFARTQVAALLGCEEEEVFFTSGGTEANNLAIFGATRRRSDRRHVVTSTVEHPATERPCRSIESSGWEVTRIPVRSDGDINPADVRPFVRGDTALVTVMLANNETGTLMPIPAIAEVAHERGALVHTDAAQAVGKVSTRVRELGVDLLSIAGHKLYAPKGVGALYVRKGTAIQPLVLGAGHERGLRPGTANARSSTWSASTTS